MPLGFSAEDGGGAGGKVALEAGLIALALRLVLHGVGDPSVAAEAEVVRAPDDTVLARKLDGDEVAVVRFCWVEIEGKDEIALVIDDDFLLLIDAAADGRDGQELFSSQQLDHRTVEFAQLAVA